MLPKLACLKGMKMLMMLKMNYDCIIRYIVQQQRRKSALKNEICTFCKSIFQCPENILKQTHTRTHTPLLHPSDEWQSCTPWHCGYLQWNRKRGACWDVDIQPTSSPCSRAAVVPARVLEHEHQAHAHTHADTYIGASKHIHWGRYTSTTLVI